MDWLIQLLRHKPAGRTVVLSVLLAALAGLAAGRNLIPSVSVVDGVSMDPGFPDGTRVFPEAIKGQLERGDVVILDDGKEELALKRIVALPGETLSFYRGYVFVNGRLLREPYLRKHTFTFPVQQARESWSRTVPEQHYFVMGDNRSWSVDSRSYGPVKRSQIKRRLSDKDNPVRAFFDDTCLLPTTTEPRLIVRSSRAISVSPLAPQAPPPPL